MIVAISGGFDPLHKEHIIHIEEALKLGNLLVILARDDQLERKKGYCYQPFAVRRSVIEWGLQGRGNVVKNIDGDVTSKESLKYYSPDIFAKGGDTWNENNLPEAEICRELNIEIRFGVGVKKNTQSSTGFTNRIIQMVKEGKL